MKNIIFFIERFLLLRSAILIAHDLIKRYGFNCYILKNGFVDNVEEYIVKHNGTCSIICRKSALYVCKRTGRHNNPSALYLEVCKIK